MDFGFGSLIDKFEQLYGRFLTKLLVGVLGLCAFTLAGQFLWKNVISPLIPIISAAYARSNFEGNFLVIGAMCIATVAIQLAGGLIVSKRQANDKRSYAARRMGIAIDEMEASLKDGISWQAVISGQREWLTQYASHTMRSRDLIRFILRHKFKIGPAHWVPGNRKPDRIK